MFCQLLVSIEPYFLSPHSIVALSQRARVQRGESSTARCASTEDFRVFPLPAALAYPFKGSLVDPLVRASNEHILIVRVPRARGRPGCPSSLIVG
jgi:hypothetical protein